jgi:hypothetical protein
VPAFAAVNVVLAGGWIATAGLLNVALRRKARETHTAEL